MPEIHRICNLSSLRTYIEKLTALSGLLICVFCNGYHAYIYFFRYTDCVFLHTLTLYTMIIYDTIVFHWLEARPA